MLNKNQRNRDFIRYAAFVMLAIRYQGTEKSVEPLRKRLLGPILLPPTGPIGTQAPASRHRPTKQLAEGQNKRRSLQDC